VLLPEAAKKQEASYLYEEDVEDEDDVSSDILQPTQVISIILGHMKFFDNFNMISHSQQRRNHEIAMR
jgi:hypothetical protein